MQRFNQVVLAVLVLLILMACCGTEELIFCLVCSVLFLMTYHVSRKTA
jgi:hypothetical protein